MTETQIILTKIQKVLKAPKNQFNKFGGYNYRSCEDILEAVKPFLESVPVTITDELVLIGNRYYVKATVTFGEISVSAYAREEENKKGMDASQITGSASSYARKYALNGLFLIDDTKDADATNKHGKEEQKQEKKTEPKQSENSEQSEPLSPAQKRALEGFINETGITRDIWKEWLYMKKMIGEIDGQPSISTMTKENAKKVLDNRAYAKDEVNKYIASKQ